MMFAIMICGGSPVLAETTPVSSDTALAGGRALFAHHCSSCHEEKIATALRNDRDGWKAIVDRMYGLGLTASDEDAEKIIEYLAAAYPVAR